MARFGGIRNGGISDNLSYNEEEIALDAVVMPASTMAGIHMFPAHTNGLILIMLRRKVNDIPTYHRCRAIQI